MDREARRSAILSRIPASYSPVRHVVVPAAFGLSVLFGAIAQRTHFCTMGAVADIVNIGDWARMRMWILAMGVAMIGFNLMVAAGWLDAGRSIYGGPRFVWLSALVGGALFGFGMVLASGCGSKALVRIGGGSLKALITFVFLGIAAYMTLKGLFALARIGWIDPVATNLANHEIPRQDVPTLIAALTGAKLASVEVAVAGAVALALLAFVLKDREFRSSFDHLLGGTVVGLVIVGGWYVTGHMGLGESETLEQTYFGTNSRTIESLSFTAPVGYALELLMLWSDKSLTVTFGIAATAGLILGSLAYALVSKTFRWEGFAGAEDTANHVVGGILMGFGGVTAVGCTVGQGLTGLSTLALGSILAFIAIVMGSALTMKYQYWRMTQAA